MTMKVLEILLFVLSSQVFVAPEAGGHCNVPPIYREECGWPGISGSTCISRGCCFDSSVWLAKWCFKKSKPGCDVLPSRRRDCGWPGISQSTCEGRGCCFNSNVWGTIWCFYPE